MAITNRWIDKYTPRRASQRTPWLVLAMGPGNLPAVQVWTGKTVRFGTRPVQKPDPELLGGPNLHPYLSTRGFCWVWLDPSVLLSGFHFRVFLFMVAVRCTAVMCKILTLVHHSLYLSHLLPLYSKPRRDMLPATSCSWVWTNFRLASLVRFEVHNSHIDSHGSHYAENWSVGIRDCADIIGWAHGDVQSHQRKISILQATSRAECSPIRWT